MSEYLAHFGLKKAPFSTTPDPAFAFATREHKQALAKIKDRAKPILQIR